ncbi:MAG: DUF4139 domain-containing protein [Nannocystaceae bacterium]
MSTRLSSTIEAVTVYRRGAMITRVIEIADAATCGESVEVVGLPLCLEDRSVRVQVEGGPGLVAADVRVGLDVAEPDPDLPAPESAELRAARRRLRELESRRAHLEVQLRRLRQEHEVARPAGREGEPPPPSPYRGRRALGEFRAEAVAALDLESEGLKVETRAAKEALAELQARDREASSARQTKPHEMRKTAQIRLERRAGALGPRRVVIEYMVPGARWSPTYTVTFDRGMGRATLAVRAVVAQRTGEEWRRVRLTLSTADAQRWTELQELHSLRIGRRQPQPPRRGWRPPPTGAEALFADYDRFRGRVAAQPVEPEPELVRYDEVEELDEDLDDLAMLDDGGGAALHRDKARALAKPSPAKKRKGGARREMAKEEASRQAYPSFGAAPPMQQSTLVGGLAPPMPQAAMPMAPPKGAPMRSRSGGPFASSGGGGGPADTGAYPLADEALAPEPREDPSDLLAYGDLRMPAPTASGRGKLVLVQRQQRIRELVTIRREAFVDEVIVALERASGLAGGAGASLPPRHAWPASVDGFDYAYVADGQVDVEADGDFHGIPLLARDAEVRMIHVVVPRESTDVFRVATFANPLDAPLLAGPADVYVGGDYLLTCDLPLAPARGEVRLGLGVEQAIKVSRNTAYAEESAGLIGGSLLLKHRVAVEVKNGLERAAHVEVRERTPSLREGEDEITLEVGPVEPRWEVYEPEEYALKGGHRWRVDVPGGGSQTLRAAYTVKISAKKELLGGNRREA